MNKFHKISLSLSLLLVAFVVVGFGMKNTKLNEDMNFSVNVGGSQKDAILITGATGAVTLAPPLANAGTLSNGPVTAQSWASSAATGDIQGILFPYKVASGSPDTIAKILANVESTSGSRAGGLEFFTKKLSGLIQSMSISAVGNVVLGPTDSTASHTFYGTESGGFAGVGAVNIVGPTARLLRLSQTGGLAGAGDLGADDTYALIVEGSSGTAFEIGHDKEAHVLGSLVVTGSGIFGDAVAITHAGGGQSLTVTKDLGAGDSTASVETWIGNSNPGEGKLQLGYTNALPGNSPRADLIFRPRTQAGGPGSDFEAARIAMVKTTGANTASVAISNTSAALTLNADGSLSATGTVATGNVPHGCIIESDATNSTTPLVTCTSPRKQLGGGCSSALTTNVLYASFPSTNGWLCSFATANASNTAYANCCYF